MKSKIYICGVVAFTLFVALICLADMSVASGNEDKALGILDKVLDVIAEFFDKIFQSIADAVKSVWNGGSKE